MFLVRYFVHGVDSFAPLNCPHKSLVLSDFSVLQGCHCSLFRTLVEGRRGPNDKQTFPQLIINFFLIIFSFSYTSTDHVRFDLMNSRLSPCLIKTFPSAINIGERIETTDVGLEGSDRFAFEERGRVGIKSARTTCSHTTEQTFRAIVFR